MSFIRPYALFIQCFLFPRCCQSLVVFRGWCASLFLQADKPIQFLRQLMSSSEYMDKNSAAYAMAEKYLNLLYPGAAQLDATGRMTEPPYDMTLAQFNKAQDALEAALEEAKQEAEAEYEEAGQEIDIDAYVELEEAIDVRVLMPLGTIENKQLEVYTLDLPEDDDDTPNNKTRRVWRWHSEDGDNTCDECASRDGEIYDSEDDIPAIPVHPNCRCSITEDVIGPDGRTISSKSYKPKTPTVVAPNTAEKSPNTPAEKATFEKPVNTKPGQYAVFDGKTLVVYDAGEKVAEFAGVSGKPGYQSPQYQNKKDTGPIPAGTYVARKKDFQNRDDYGPIKKYTSWPGGERGWGKHRVWLEPSKETDTYGRGGFSIHGGEEPGSAGCIDLTSEMPAFVDWFKKNGKDLIIKVKY